MNDTLLAKQGINLLIDGLGKVEAERFIAMLLSEPFDYTEWQKDLFEGMSREELHKAAMENTKNIPLGITYRNAPDSVQSKLSHLTPEQMRKVEERLIKAISESD